MQGKRIFLLWKFKVKVNFAAGFFTRRYRIHRQTFLSTLYASSSVSTSVVESLAQATVTNGCDESVDAICSRNGSYVDKTNSDAIQSTWNGKQLCEQTGQRSAVMLRIEAIFDKTRKDTRALLHLLSLRSNSAWNLELEYDRYDKFEKRVAEQKSCPFLLSLSFLSC